ncbi:CoA transferase [Microbacterium sp. 1.5R]|uniref:CoA transferase n=1 Tax=Microbacterium sp. 1.5R TaxID=1916917 RepID=UPI0021B461FB|nr:CoA transferase [Microbacterium sp. 1.5R]
MESVSSTAAASALLDRVWEDLDIRPAGAADHLATAGAVPLPSRLATSELAWSSVRAAGLLGGIPAPPDPGRVAVAYRSERVLTIDRIAPSVWAPLSGFWRTRDGWVRTHANYPHHEAALLHALDLSAGATASTLEAVAGERSSDDLITAIVGAGGLAVTVSPERPDHDRVLRDTPLLELHRIPGPPAHGRLDGSDAQPLRGIRVLDLTRVIAGPVCTRTLALLGADVLRVDPPELSEPEWLHLDTGHGKRSVVLDARTERFHDLAARADVVVLGYRPSSLARLGITPEALLSQHPSLVVAALSAWGHDRPERAGFDSLVQAESGIAIVESADGLRPGVLPAQALDHSAGYLLAAAVVAALRRRDGEGGGWTVRTSLRRIAAELLGMPRGDEPQAPREIDTAAHVSTFDVDGRRVTTARPALPGLEFTPPRRWGRDQPRW